MPTLSSRINVTVPPEVAGVLHVAAKRKRKSLSKVAAEYIAWAIEEREDRYLAKTADEAFDENGETVPDSDDIWK